MSLCGNNNPCPDLITGQKCGITYTGARYVPLFADPAQWDNTKAYEPLTIVLNEGNSYTSKTFVPVGVDINNEMYWALTGNYNAQVEAYHQEVKNLGSLVKEKITVVNTLKNVKSTQLNTYIRTLGFNEQNDGGEGLYYYSETPSDLSVIQDGFYMNYIAGNLINVVCMGADNTGLNECSDIIRKCLEQSNYRTVYFPAGTYKINKPLFLYSGSILGENINSTFIKTENYINDNKYSILQSKDDSVIYLLNNNYLTNETGNTNELSISNITINGSSTIDAICFPLKTSRCQFNNIMINTCKNGFNNYDDTWIVNFKEVNVYYATNGFYITRGFITSLNFESCYVIESDYAFYLKGIYCVLNNCLSDQIKIANFYLTEFSGTLISPSSESVNIINNLIAYYSDLTIINPTFFLSNNENYVSLSLTGDSCVNVLGGVIGTPLSSINGYLYKFTGNDNKLSLYNTKYNKNLKLNDVPLNSWLYDSNNGQINKNGYRTFIGKIPSSYNNENAIYLGNYSTPATNINNDNWANSAYNSSIIGDLFFIKNPGYKGIAGWINDQDYTQDIPINGTITAINNNRLVMSESISYNDNRNTGNGFYTNTPIKSSSGGEAQISYITPNEIEIKNKTGSWNVGDTVYLKSVTTNSYLHTRPIASINIGITIQRPISPVAGCMYYDQTLNKPIWYTGSKWVDATGTDV